MSNKSTAYSCQGVTAIVAPCSARKEILSDARLRAATLTRGSQRLVAKAWLSRLKSAPLAGTPARTLYAGRSFLRLRDSAEHLGCKLFVVSAGLGLLESTTLVPSYDLTLSAAGVGALRERLTHPPRPSDWWAGLEASPFASSMGALCVGNSRILVALTQPYAELVGNALAMFADADRTRLRLLGFGLKPFLPVQLHPQLIRYDDRLDRLAPGTRLDGASRALAHFAELVAMQPLDSVEVDQRLVDAALGAVPHAVRPTRKRVSDREIAKHVARFVKEGLSATAALKQLRSMAKIACEERRFRDLYQEASR